jgi:prepilin-type N-terminal cleavage/methylation domain-containing protein
MGERRRAGYTLLEMLVVMVLLGLAAAVVLPALVTPPHDTTPLRDLIATTQEAAADRGEVLYLRIDAGGAWLIEGANPREGTLEHGRLPEGGAPLTLIVSPLGSCAPDVPSAASGASPALDALGCDLARPAAHSGP